jgi:uncharacterized protein YozE (UPF0346 family)
VKLGKKIRGSFGIKEESTINLANFDKVWEKYIYQKIEK